MTTGPEHETYPVAAWQKDQCNWHSQKVDNLSGSGRGTLLIEQVADGAEEFLSSDAYLQTQRRQTIYKVNRWRLR